MCRGNQQRYIPDLGLCYKYKLFILKSQVPGRNGQNLPKTEGVVLGTHLWELSLPITILPPFNPVFSLYGFIFQDSF